MTSCIYMIFDKYTIMFDISYSYCNLFTIQFENIGIVQSSWNIA
jgi:hypothetical protein